MSKQKQPKQAQPEVRQLPPPTEGEVIISVSIPAKCGAARAESGFSLELWNRAKDDPSTTQFIIGALREALEAKAE